MFVQEDHEFPCANGTLRLLGRPRPSSTAEVNVEREDDDETEEGDNKGSTSDILGPCVEIFIYRS